MDYDPIVSMALSQGDHFTPGSEDYVCVLPCTVVGKSAGGWHIARNGVTKTNEGELLPRDKVVNTGCLGKTLTEARILNQYRRLNLEEITGKTILRATHNASDASVVLITVDSGYCCFCTDYDAEDGTYFEYRDLTILHPRASGLIDNETWSQYMTELELVHKYQRRVAAEMQLRQAQVILNQLDRERHS
jgi:hypothetical protein